MQQRFVQAMTQLNFDIKIIVLSFHYPFHEKTYQWFGATVIPFNGRNRSGLADFFLRRKVLKTLVRIHRDQQIVGLLSFWLGECTYVGKQFSQRYGVPHYSWLMGQDARGKNKYVKRLSIEEDELIALSDFLQHEFQRNYGIKPFKVVPPGIQSSYSNTTRDIDLLGVGSFIPLKRFEVFIECVAEIKKVIDVRAVLIGDGPEKNKLNKIIWDLGLESNIILKGNIPHNEALNTMSRAKILLHPSSYEGFSGVCQEALAHGAHVLSFCRAMNDEICQWHIVKTRKEMVEKAISILTNNSTEYRKIEFNPMLATAKEIMDQYL